MKESRIKNFPIAFFAVVMGLTGLAIACMSMAFLGTFFTFTGIALTIISTLIFGIFLIVYSIKIFKYPEEVKKEFNHPIKSSFFPTVSISLLLLSIAYGHINSFFALFFWISGTILHFILLIRTIRFWINEEFKVELKNPAWFIPVVGAIIVPIQGVNYSKELSWFFFSIGIIFWIILFTIVVYRIIFHSPLPERLSPTLFILMAPPAVGFISYIKITASIDTFSNLLFYFTLFLCIVLFSLIQKFIKLRFYISWWAYTFPLDALTISIILRYKLTQLYFYKNLGVAALIITTFVIGIVSLRTLIAIKRKEICVEE